MSENTIPQAADETSEAQLPEGALEDVAGGCLLHEIAEAVIEAITPDMPTVY